MFTLNLTLEKKKKRLYTQMYKKCYIYIICFLIEFILYTYLLITILYINGCYYSSRNEHKLLDI